MCYILSKFSESNVRINSTQALSKEQIWYYETVYLALKSRWYQEIIKVAVKL